MIGRLSGLPGASLTIVAAAVLECCGGGSGASPAADAGGGDGVRLLRAFTCVDEGQTNIVAGMGERRICTLEQLATKDANGDFIYQDWQGAVDGVYDDEDVHAEVSAYYHAQRIYGFVTSPEVGVFDRLPWVHETASGTAPINIVANYRYPSADGLVPMPMAFCLPPDLVALGMGAVDGLVGQEGAFIALGQGPRADFAYDGETVYHEFGHLINRALAGLEYNVFADEHGLSNTANALEQGLAETFVFLVSGRSALFDYIDQVTVTGGFLRDVDNDDRFPDDVDGFDQFDGLIVAGANYEAFRLLEEEGLSEEGFARALLLALVDMGSDVPAVAFSEYAEAFLAALGADGRAGLVPAVRAVFEERGLFEEVRAKDVTDYRAQDGEILAIGSAGAYMWNTWLTVEEGEGTANVAPAYVQTYVETGAGETTARITALAAAMPDGMGMYPVDDDLRFRLYARRAEPILYHVEGSGPVQVERDDVLDPAVEVEETPEGPMERVTWTLEGLDPDTRYYLHVVGYGLTPGVLMSIDVSLE